MRTSPREAWASTNSGSLFDGQLEELGRVLELPFLPAGLAESEIVQSLPGGGGHLTDGPVGFGDAAQRLAKSGAELVGERVDGLEQDLFAAPGGDTDAST